MSVSEAKSSICPLNGAICLLRTLTISSMRSTPLIISGYGVNMLISVLLYALVLVLVAVSAAVLVLMSAPFVFALMLVPAAVALVLMPVLPKAKMLRHSSSEQLSGSSSSSLTGSITAIAAPPAAA